MWLVYFFMTTPGSYGTSVISTRMVTDYGWNEGLIGLASSTYFACMAVFSTISGMMESRIGYRKTILVGAVVGAAGFVVLLFGYTFVPVYLAVFGLIGACCAMGGLTAGPGLVNTWFGENSIMPMALLMTAGSIGGFIMPMVSQFLAGVSVRLCWIVYGIMCLLSILLALFVIRDDDGVEKRGAEAATKAVSSDGQAESAAADSTSQSSEPDGQKPSKLSYYTNFTFWAIVLQQLAIRAAAFGILSYIVLHAVQSEISPIRAALLVTIFNVANFTGRLASGVSDRLHVTPKQLCMGSLFFCGAGCAVIGLSHGFAGYAAGAAIAGFGFGIGCTIKGVLVALCFGSENFAVVNGVLESLSLLGNVLAPILVYQAAMLLGGYSNAYKLLGVFELLCLIPIIRTRIARVKLKTA